MKKQNPEKQAYQAPVVRSVEFKVENGFLGSVPITNSLENVGYSSNNYGSNDNGSYFSYSFGSTNQ